MKHVMIFSYWFPPANAVGSSRAAAMARYFAARGWRVTVVAGASEAVPPTFATDMTGVDVHYIPDGWLTRHSSFKPGRGVIAQRLSTALRLLSWPDHCWPVARAMKRRALALLDRAPPPSVVLSTALPFSVHGAARDVARQSGALFVSDNRDVWAHNPYKWTAPFYTPFERRHERHMLAAADLVVANSAGMADHYRSAYPELSNRIVTIMNGVDEDRAAPARTRANTSPLRLVYTGILYGDRRDVTPLLRAAQACAAPVAIDFYGSEPHIIRRFAAEYPDIAIRDCGNVPRAEALAAQSAADALILVVGTAPWEDIVLPGKLFEYVGSGRPIIALANAGSDTGRIIAQYDLGIVATQEKEIAAFLNSLSGPGSAGRPAVPAALTREHQLRMLEEQFDTMLVR